MLTDKQEGWQVPPKRRYVSTRLYPLTFQKGMVFRRLHGTLKPRNQTKLQISPSHIKLKPQPLHVADKGDLV